MVCNVNRKVSNDAMSCIVMHCSAMLCKLCLTLSESTQIEGGSGCLL